MRLWLRFLCEGAGLSDAVSVSVVSCKGGGASDSNNEGSSLGLAMGSQSTPCFTMRLIVSPSWTLYSFSSLASASALPFRRSRCAEAGGARGWSAIWVLMEDMGSAGETGMVMENGGLRDLNVIWIVLGANQADGVVNNIVQCALRIRDRTHRRTGAPLPFSTLEAGELGAGYQHIGREADDVRFAVLETVDREWIDAHLNDGGYLEGFLWLFLKVVMERDWLGCDDVDERLDKLVFCLTRHSSGLHTTRRATNKSSQIQYALARSGALRSYYCSTLLHLSYLGGSSYHGCKYTPKRSFSIVLY